MVGPILAQELLLGSRRGQQHVLRRIYTGWLLLQLLFFYLLYVSQADLVGHWMFGTDINADAASEFGNSFVSTLVWQQLILLLLITPAFTAGAITDEKSRGTLQYLLTADLTSLEIIVGKLLGRVAQVAVLALAALPLMCFIGVFGGLNVVVLIGLFTVTLVPLLALGSVSLLASVWCRQTRDAVITVYLCVFAAYLILWATDKFFLFSPLYVLEPAWGDSKDLRSLAGRLLVSTVTWGGLGGTCLGLAAWRLRPAYLRQLAGEGRPRRARWWRARRAAVPDEPVRWKERHIEGLAPLAALRSVPRWLGILTIVIAALASSVGILAAHLGQDISLAEFFYLLKSLDVVSIMNLFGPAQSAFLWQSVVAMLVATMLVGVRCSGAITGERERQTWEALLLSPLPIEALVRGKLWGIIGASYPYLLAYAIPALSLAWLGGWMSVFWTLLWLGVTWLAMGFVGAAGLCCSAHCKSSWRSLLFTVAIAYGGGFFLYGIAWPVAMIGFVVILLTLMVIDFLNNNQTSLAQSFGSTSDFYVVASCLALVGGFLAMIWLFLSDTQKYIANRERIRHWKEEQTVTRARRRRGRLTARGQKRLTPEKPSPHQPSSPDNDET